MKLSKVITPFFCIAFLGIAEVGHTEHRVYFGNLHAHSKLSDGNSTIDPGEAYRIARVEGNLDFLSLSEHNHMLTGDEMASLIQAADQATSSNFVALYGQEYSTINSGFNHTNIHNYPEAIPDWLNGQYQRVFSQVLADFALNNLGTTILAGFNHPHEFATDYGLKSDYNGDWTGFIRDLDPFVQLIAIGNGPADVNNKSFVPTQNERFEHRDITKGRWFQYLSHGMHLAPKVDHDSHSPTYGFRVATRTAVWIDGTFNKARLLEALSSRHCYSTEDMNLTIIARVGDGNLPGDIIEEVAGDSIAINLSITDSDERAARYIVNVYSGVMGSENVAIRVEDLRRVRTGNGDVSLMLPTETDVSLYYVIHIKQESSDPVSGCSRDDAYLAPIWVEGQIGDDWPSDSAPYASSRKSKVYHLANCGYVQSISSKNLEYHQDPPEGKRLHKGCPR